MMTNDDIENAKNAKKYVCEKCDFKCSKKSNFKTHLSTKKHKMVTNDDTKSPKNAQIYICECGKSYRYRQGLSIHKKKCTLHTDVERKKPESDHASLAKELVPLIKDLIIEIAPVLQPNHTINDNRQNFNINMFLNEQCKDAMNITDFVDSMQLSIEDVTNIGEQGQTTGFANILIDKLTSMDLYKRPLHCSDAKRETLYVKSNDEWNKEPDDRPHIKEAIDYISRKSIQKVPDLSMTDEQISDTIFEIVKTPVNHKKIISKVAKEVKV
jgi:hypothetical protein